MASKSFNLASKSDLESLNEDPLRRDVLIPLLGHLNFADIVDVHSSIELGRDVVATKVDDFGTTKHWNVVAKAEKLTGKALEKTVEQVQQCFRNPFHDARGVRIAHAERVLVAVNKRVVDQTWKQLESKLAEWWPEITVLDLDRLWDKWTAFKSRETLMGLLQLSGRYSDQELSTGSVISFEIDGHAVNISPIGTCVGRGSNERQFDSRDLLDVPTIELPLFVPSGGQITSGEMSVDEAVLELGRKTEAGEPLPQASVDLHVYCDDGDFVALPGLEMTFSSRTSDTFKAGNKAQQIPIEVELNVDSLRMNSSIDFRIKPGPAAAFWMHKWFELLRCWSKAGHTELLFSEARVELAWSRRPAVDFEQADSGFANLISELATLEWLLGQPILLPEAPSPQVLKEARELVSMLRSGEVKGTWGSLAIEHVTDEFEVFVDGAAHAFSFETIYSAKWGESSINMGRAIFTLESAIVPDLAALNSALNSGPSSSESAELVLLEPGPSNTVRIALVELKNRTQVKQQSRARPSA